MSEDRSAAEARSESEQREYQRTFYDRHYAKRTRAVEEQLAHPLFRSFYDRLARQVLDVGLAARGGDDGGRPVRVFEPGCGEGLLGSALQRVAPERGLRVSYVGSDVSASALELTRRGVDGELFVGDATESAASLPPGSQDVVVAKNLLHHLDDPAEFLRQAARAVGPQGRVVAFEPRLGCPHFWVFNALAPRRERYFFYGQRRNLRAFAAAGLRVVEGGRFSWLPYELALVIRPPWFRRLLSTSDPRALQRFSDLDDRLTATLPWFASYAVWVTAPGRPEGAVASEGTNRA